MSPTPSKPSIEMEANEKPGKIDLKRLDVGKIGNYVLDPHDPRMNFYVKGGYRIMGDCFELLGFQNQHPVVKSHYNLNETNIKQNLKIVKALPFSNGESGEKFIKLKDGSGKTIKLLPMCVNKAKSPIKSPPKSIVNNIPININKDPSKLSPPPLIKLEPADASIKDNMHKFKLITTLQQSTTVSSSSKIIPDDCVNPPDLEEPLLGGNNNPTKLLSKKHLQILSEMQALNLSMKEKVSDLVKVSDPVPVSDPVSVSNSVSKVNRGVQTEIIGNKRSKDQSVQTDNQDNKTSFHNVLELFDLDGFLMGGDSPVLNDVNFGSGPTMPVISNVRTCSNMGHSISDKDVSNLSEDDSMKKRLMFFRDLRECLNYNIEGNLPIHEGVISNNVSFVQRHCIALKMRKQSVNMENHNGFNPLQLAIIHNVDIQIVQMLLNAGANIKETDAEGNNIFHLLAQFKRLNMLEITLTHCKQNNLFDYVNSYNFDGLTPLMICCESSWTLGAQRFIKAGVSVDLKDQTSGRTALFHAAEAQNVEIVKLLLDNKADPKIKNFFGTSPHDAMYELEDMHERIKSMIFGKSKKRSHEAEMNPVRTAKAARSLKTFSRLHRVDPLAIDGSNGISTSKIKHKLQRQIK